MNIKDSYIHGDLAVVRSIESLSVSGGNLVLTYKKADSGSTQETKTIAISSFNSALSNKFVTLDTAQTVSGKKTFSNGIVVLNGLLFDKGGTSTSDDVFHIDGISSYAGKIYLTGANASNSTNSTTQLVFQSGTTKGAAITSNGNNVIINPSESSTTGLIILLPGTGVNAYRFISTIADGTAPLTVTSKTLVSNLHADLLDGQHGSYYATASSLGNYLPLSGGTLTGHLAEDISIKSRIYYIMHMNDDFNASNTSNIRGGIFYGNPAKDDTAATSNLTSYTNHGLGLYIVGYKTADYSRLVMSFLSGIYLDSDTSITGNLTTSGSFILKNGSTSTYTTINAKTTSGNITLNLPSSAGTLALTTQIPTSFTITANATDGLWNLTGTNGSNAVTYAVGAYSAQLSKASFDTSSTNPTRTDRLNYNGYFYATKLYSGAKEVITADNASNLKWANLSVSSSVNYATKPVFDQVSIGGSSSVTAGAATIKYNSTNQSIDFIFN